MASEILERLRMRKQQLTGSKPAKRKRSASEVWQQYPEIRDEVIEVAQQTKCQRTEDCILRAKHSGRCTDRTPEQREAAHKVYMKEWRARDQAKVKAQNHKDYEKAKAAQNGNDHQPARRKAIIALSAKTVPVSAPVIVPEITTLAPVPRCRFQIFFEEIFSDGEVDRIDVSGRNRAQFDRVISALAQLIQG